MIERVKAEGERRAAVSGLGLYAGLALCLFTGLLLFYGFWYPLHQDMAGSILSGRLAVTLGDAFRDYSVYFPPAEKLWFSLAVHLSDLTGFRVDLVVVTMTGAMILFGAGLAYRIRRATVGASPLFFVASVAVLTFVPILFKNIFGLREHLVVLGLWPYLVLRVSDPEGTQIGGRLRAILGLWMGFTLLFKYVYSVVVALVELADSSLQRRVGLLFRIENVVAGSVVFLYLFFWLGIDPSQREAIGAMASAIDANLDEPALNWLKAARTLFFGLILALASRIFKVPTRQTALAFAALLGTVIAAWTQQRWYTHHLFPITMAYVAWWWIACKQFRWWGHVAMALYLGQGIREQFLSISAYHKPLDELTQVLDRRGLSVAGKRVALLNAHPSPFNEYLVARSGLRWTPMMNNASVSAELKPFDKPENEGKPPPPVKFDDPGRRLLHDQMLKLWEALPPDVLILDRTRSWPLLYVEIDWIQVFSNDQRFKAILAHYRPVLVHDGKLMKFTYYERVR